MLAEFPLNYDDWNEHFWSLRTIVRVRTVEGQPLMAAAPPDRWQLLLHADWQEFFSGCVKTHRELRWWWCLLAGNRRIGLLHILGFILCFIAALPQDTWSFNGWGRLRIVPLMLVAAPLSRCVASAKHC